MAANGQVLPGSRITAPMIRSVAPLAAYKASSTPITSNTTLQNDGGLSVPVAANAFYFFECMLVYTGGTQGSSDLKFAWSIPPGSGINYEVTGQTTSGGATTGYLRNAAGMAVGTGGSGNNYAVTMVGTLAVGSTAGTLQLQWAQNTSSTTATTVQSGSILSLWQVQ